MNIRNLILCFIVTVFCAQAKAQTNPLPWKSEQMLSPENLVSVIKNNNANQPLIISVGPSGLIKGAVNIGPAREEANAENLKKLLAKEKKDKAIIVYCGCCPYKNCPNIRPAYTLLNSMKFTNFKLLDLPQNLKTDWIDKGYPMSR
jgi:hypothetical protein